MTGLDEGCERETRPLPDPGLHRRRYSTMKHGINSIKLHISRIRDCIREIIFSSQNNRKREESEETFRLMSDVNVEISQGVR